MRTNPPGEDREEGEGKKPTVVGEPGGLEGKKKKNRSLLCEDVVHQQTNTVEDQGNRRSLMRSLVFAHLSDTIKVH